MFLLWPKVIWPLVIPETYDEKDEEITINLPSGLISDLEKKPFGGSDRTLFWNTSNCNY